LLIKNKFLEAIEAEIGENDPQAVKNLKTLYKSCLDIGKNLGYNNKIRCLNAKVKKYFRNN